MSAFHMMSRAGSRLEWPVRADPGPRRDNCCLWHPVLIECIYESTGATLGGVTKGFFREEMGMSVAPSSRWAGLTASLRPVRFSETTSNHANHAAVRAATSSSTHSVSMATRNTSSKRRSSRGSRLCSRTVTLSIACSRFTRSVSEV